MNELDLPISTRHILRIISGSSYIQYSRRKASPWITKEHKKARLEFAYQHIDEGTQWSKVIFSDEKEFNLDGPDGFQFYWWDLRKEREIFSKRQSGGGFVMVWGAMCSTGLSDLFL